MFSHDAEHAFFEANPVGLVTGPRHSGKTLFLMEQMARDIERLSKDRQDTGAVEMVLVGANRAQTVLLVEIAAQCLGETKLSPMQFSLARRGRIFNVRGRWNNQEDPLPHEACLYLDNYGQFSKRLKQLISASHPKLMRAVTTPYSKQPELAGILVYLKA